MTDFIKFQDIQEIFETFLLMKDKDLVRITIAAVLGNQMPGRRPIWLMLVAPPSSGKTTTLNALLGMKVATPAGEIIEPIVSISDLTENSFASGMKRSDRETSLLKRIPYGGVMVFKDFTSVLSKNNDAKRIIMGQLREIYDGAYIKRTGTGDDIDWTGKVGAIAGVTESVYQHLESLSVMGDRFVLYQIEQPDRKEMLRFKLKQERDGKTEDIQMPIAKEMLHAYMDRAYREMKNIKFTISPEIEEEIIDVADFCTMVRSGIITNDYTGNIIFVPQPEMPARMFEQMIALATTFAYMRKLDNPDTPDSELVEQHDLDIVYKIAYDSIPVTRRIALNYLARFRYGVDTAGLAIKTNYPTDVVRGWLQQLNALGVVTRKKGRNSGDTWVLARQYQGLMSRLNHTKPVDEVLGEAEAQAERDEIEKSWEMERMKEMGMLEYSDEKERETEPEIVHSITKATNFAELQEEIENERRSDPDDF